MNASPFPTPPELPVTPGRARLGPVELAYELAGPTPEAAGRLPIVLVMGFSLPGRGWRFVRPGLAADRTVLSFDNRGAGESDKPVGPYSMNDLAGDVLALTEHLRFARFHLVGVSMGGMIVQHVALAARPRLASLTLIATHPGGLAARLPKASGIASFVGANLTKSPTRRYEALGKMLFPAPFRAQVGQDTLESVMRIDFEPPAPKHARRAQLAAVMGHDTRSRLRELDGLPTLIMRPDLDVLVRPSGSDTLHRLIPGSQLVTFPDAGHGLIRQKGDEVARLIREHCDVAEATTS